MTTAAGESATLDSQAKLAREKLDAHVREIIAWHFDPKTGTPFWLERIKKLGFDPRKEVKGYDDLKIFGLFEDEWLRGGPVRRWVPLALQDKPIYVFETGGTTGIPKSRIGIEDFRTDYSMFSETLPEKYFPKGANWLMLGPSGPRRLRLAVEHLCQHRGGICFCIDLDPRWVVKLIKKGWMEHLNAYKEHCIEQALTILKAGHDIKCMFTTPKLLESMAGRLRRQGSSVKETGITGIFSGGTEFTPQFTRFAVEELLEGVYMTPTYGNTLMGLACSKPVSAEDGYKITYYAPATPGRAASGGFRRPRKDRALWANRPGDVNHAHQGILHAAFPGARRGRARKALREISMGRRQRRAAFPRIRGGDHGGGLLDA